MDELDAARALLAQTCDSLKVFPLPGAVVLPGTPAPFHIFEPRYRALVRDALAGDRFLAIPTLVSAEDAMQLRPPVHPVAGAVIIEAEEPHEDGKYDILVRGVARVRLVEELENGKAYREFRAELLDDVYPPDGERALLRHRAALEACVLQLAEVLPPESGAPRLAEMAARIASPSQLADLVAAAVVSEPDNRLRIIEERDVARRLDLVTAEVAGVILMLSRGRTPRA